MVLLSNSPDGVRQEIYGYLCTHYAIRALISDVAARDDLDPDRVSFTRSLRADPRTVRAGIGTSSRAIGEALCVAVAEIGRQLLAERALRSAARRVNRKMSKLGVWRAVHRNLPRPTKRAGEGNRHLSPP